MRAIGSVVLIATLLFAPAATAQESVIIAPGVELQQPPDFANCFHLCPQRRECCPLIVVQPGVESYVTIEDGAIIDGEGSKIYPRLEDDAGQGYIIRMNRGELLFAPE